MQITAKQRQHYWRPLMFPDIPFNAWTFQDSAYFLCPSLTFMKKTVSIYYRKYYIMTAFSGKKINLFDMGFCI
jgi:hypothetical protein